MAAFSDDWLQRFQQRINADAEMHVIGDWFTLAFSLTCGESRCILRFERGVLVEILQSPRLDARCAFGFRAVIEGDTLVAMQHARALHRAMNVLRTVEP